jgi:hypothetical protein
VRVKIGALSSLLLILSAGVARAGTDVGNGFTRAYLEKNL